MHDAAAFAGIPSTTVADLLGPEQVMSIAIHSLWTPVPHVVGPAFTVRCPPGDNLMLHAAIHRADSGSIIVVDAGGDEDYAVAGGNVCAVAQRRGVAALVVDGVIRDPAEVRERRFPVFGRGVMPIPGGKSIVEPLNAEVTCGGVNVSAGDIVVADEDGIVVVPAARRHQLAADARTRLGAEVDESLDAWEATHRARIDQILREKGFDA